MVIYLDDRVVVDIQCACGLYLGSSFFLVEGLHNSFLLLCIYLALMRSYIPTVLFLVNIRFFI